MHNQQIHFSRYLRWRQRNDKVVVFHELHPEPIYLNYGIWRKILYRKISSTVSPRLKKNLLKRKLIITSSQDDQKELGEAIRRQKNKLNQASILYLVLAEGCNLRCSYCPIPLTSRRAPLELMSPDIARAGIDLWREHIEETFDKNAEYYIILYGGEPLLNVDCIEAALTYLTQLKKDGRLPKGVKVMLSTNGILLNQKIIALLKRFKILVAIGLDGPERINDAYRFDDRGRGTFKRIRWAIRLLQRNDIPVVASVSITPQNLKLIKNYYRFFQKYNINKFGFNFLRGSLLTSLVEEKQLENYYKQASDGVIKNFKNQKDKGYEYQMEKKINGLFGKDFFPIDCTCYGNQIVILPNGQITNCPFFRNPMGDIRKIDKKRFRIWNHKLIRLWRKRLPLYNDKQYSQFEEKSISGGGCAWNAYEVEGNILARDRGAEIFTKKVFDYLIWSRLKHYD